jgi:hypothetical protein
MSVVQLLDEVLSSLQNSEDKTITDDTVPKIKKVKSMLEDNISGYKLVTSRSEFTISLVTRINFGEVAKISNVYLRLSYHYNWFALWFIAPITITLPTEWNEARNIWTCDALAWLRKNKMNGYRVQVQPFCEGLDGTLISFPSTWCTISM